MDMRPRTSEDFDIWFKKSGDPWGYGGKPIQERLKRTIKFLKKHLGKNFSGNFIEIGAYDGSFTKLLGYNFPQSKIVVNDISGVALDRAKDTISSHPQLISRTEFLLKDSLKINDKDFSESFLHVNEKPPIILFLECLYYINKTEERAYCLDNLVTLFPGAHVVISSPITGPPYFTEEELLLLLKQVGYVVSAIEILNLRWWWGQIPYFRLVAANVLHLRRSMANQVVYFFKPMEAKN